MELTFTNIALCSLLALFYMVINIPLGYYRSRYRRFSLMWFVLIHASVPVIIGLRIWLDEPLVFIPVNIALTVLGQLIGTRSARQMAVGQTNDSEQ